MGCCCGKKSGVEVEVYHAPPTPNATQLIKPGPVENLTTTKDPHTPSVTLNWRRPSNATRHRDVMRYEVSFKSEDDHSFEDMTVHDARRTMIRLTRRDGLAPLKSHIFRVRACNSDHAGEWSFAREVVDWYCQLPNCVENRKIVPVRIHLGGISQQYYCFCSKKHAKQYISEYCLIPGCQNPNVQGASATLAPTVREHFCSETHLQEAVNINGFVFLVELDHPSKHFKDLSRKFQSDWDSKRKGPCPTVEVIMQIINPALAQRLEDYRKTLPPKCQKIESYYHGTKLNCEGTVDYFLPCKDPNCGACGILQDGFVKEHIDTVRWQRYGNGFYLARNSSKANDYVGGCSTYRALLLCDVAPGKKHELRVNASDITRPPEGYHSVYGKKSSFFKSSVLNYDEIVLFDSNALCPRYLFFYRPPSLARTY